MKKRSAPPARPDRADLLDLYLQLVGVPKPWRIGGANDTLKGWGLTQLEAQFTEAVDKGYLLTRAKLEHGDRAHAQLKASMERWERGSDRSKPLCQVLLVVDEYAKKSQSSREDWERQQAAALCRICLRQIDDGFSVLGLDYIEAQLARYRPPTGNRPTPRLGPVSIAATMMIEARALGAEPNVHKGTKYESAEAMVKDWLKEAQTALGLGRPTPKRGRGVQDPPRD